MNTVKPFKPRPRKTIVYMGAEEAQARAEELFAAAEAMQKGSSRQSVFKAACDYRWLAEMKRLTSSKPRTNGLNNALSARKSGT